MSLRLTVRLSTGEEQVVDCSFQSKKAFTVALELSDDMGNDRDRFVGHGGRSAIGENDAEQAVDLPHGGYSVEGQSGRAGINANGYGSGILGHGQSPSMA
jgi:hypothetical protein